MEGEKSVKLLCLLSKSESKDMYSVFLSIPSRTHTEYMTVSLSWMHTHNIASQPYTCQFLRQSEYTMKY